jgi:NAD(P)-dependent dehydrogenase (short-subunit alcohol dehydrogenase family)
MRAFRQRGDDVFLVDNDAEAAERAAAESAPGKARAAWCDLATEQGPHEAVEAAVAAFGSLDVIFGNAGVLISAPLEKWTIAQWELSMSVNVRAPFLLTKAAAPHLARSAAASVIFTASTGAFRGHAGMPAYAASKSAILGLVRALADELSPQGIRVNCVCPGWVDTPFNDAFWAYQTDPEAARKGLLKQIPLRRQARPEDIAGVVLFLASPDANYISGSAIVVDGGYTSV